MKSVLIGNPNTDWGKLFVDDISVEQRIVALKGELRVGFFGSSTPMCIEPSVLAEFAAAVRQSDER